jgi:penicillin-binding protein 1A
VANVAHRLGIASDLALNPSIALGTSEVTPLEITTAYTAFANGGIGVQAHIVQKVKTARGKLLYQRKGVSNGRVVDPTILSMMNRMMVETLLSGTARKGGVPGWQAAGKTGTSQDFRDAWFIGYTSHLVTGVWLGNDDSSPTRKATGGNLPVEIWSRFMQMAHRGLPPEPLAGGIWQEPGLLDGLVSVDPAEIPSAPVPAASDWTGSIERPSPMVPRQPGRGTPTPPIEVGATPGSRPPPVEAMQAPEPSPSRADGRESGLRPPAPIPDAGTRRQPGAAPPRERNVFEQLFGGL